MCDLKGVGDWGGGRSVCSAGHTDSGACIATRLCSGLGFHLLEGSDFFVLGTLGEAVACGE